MMSHVNKSKAVLLGYEDLRHFSGYLYGIFFKKLQHKDMHNKKITNIVDWTDMYFIFIFHFGRYPFFGFQTH